MQLNQKRTNAVVKLLFVLAGTLLCDRGHGRLLLPHLRLYVWLLLDHATPTIGNVSLMLLSEP